MLQNGTALNVFNSFKIKSMNSDSGTLLNSIDKHFCTTDFFIYLFSPEFFHELISFKSLLLDILEMGLLFPKEDFTVVESDAHGDHNAFEKT